MLDVSRNAELFKMISLAYILIYVVPMTRIPPLFAVASIASLHLSSMVSPEFI